MTGRRLRSSVVLLALLIATGLMPAAVTADSPISHSGNRGAHALVDSPEFPGAWCDYNGSERLYRVRVRWPHVEGYNWTSGSRDYQKVSWRFQLWRDGMPSTLVYQSPLSVARTYDNQAAFWPSKSYTLPAPASSGDYYIYVQMYWYRPDNQVRGTAVHAPDYILHVWSGTDFLGQTCSWTIV